MYIVRVNTSVYFNKLQLEIFISSAPAELALQLTELLNKDLCCSLVNSRQNLLGRAMSYYWQAAYLCCRPCVISIDGWGGGSNCRILSSNDRQRPFALMTTKRTDWHYSCDRAHTHVPCEKNLSFPFHLADI